MSIVAKVYRGPIVDLTHIGHVAVVNCEGELLHACGDAQRLSYIRSCAKPIQALAALESGAVDAYGISQEELALMCASHNGESIHSQTIKRMLEKAGLGVRALQCGTHPSLNASVAKTLEAQGVVLDNSHSNCSGKHTGMLLATQYKKEDVKGYLELSHPVQQRILQTLSEVCVYPKEQIIIGIDGCGVPVHALPLDAFAHGIARFSKPSVFEHARAKAISRISDAMVTYPYMVAGKERLCTDLMLTCKGKVLAKLGADGYYTVGLKDQGIGLSFKIEDGKIPIVEALAVHTLFQLGYITKAEFDALARYHTLEVKNHRGEIVGKTVFELDLT